MDPYWCIACTKPRVKGSGFCKPCGTRHEKSPWVIAWRKYMIDVKANPKKAVFVPPKGK